MSSCSAPSCAAGWLAAHFQEPFSSQVHSFQEALSSSALSALLLTSRLYGLFLAFQPLSHQRHHKHLHSRSILTSNTFHLHLSSTLWVLPSPRYPSHLLHNLTVPLFVVVFGGGYLRSTVPAKVTCISPSDALLDLTGPLILPLFWSSTLFLQEK